MAIDRFPVLQSMSSEECSRRDALGCPRSIPWAMIAAHEQQAELNHYQSLARLAERGGLSPAEMIAVLEGRPWHTMPAAEAIERLKELLSEFEKTGNAS